MISSLISGGSTHYPDGHPDAANYLIEGLNYSHNREYFLHLTDLTEVQQELCCFGEILCHFDQQEFDCAANGYSPRQFIIVIEDSNLMVASVMN